MALKCMQGELALTLFQSLLLLWGSSFAIWLGSARNFHENMNKIHEIIILSLNFICT